MRTFKGIDRYITGDKLRTSYHVMDLLEDMFIGGKRINIISFDLRNNIMRVSLSQPMTLFIDLDSIELEIFFVPDFFEFYFEDQVQKRSWRKIRNKFFGLKSSPQPVEIKIELDGREHLARLSHRG